MQTTSSVSASGGLDVQGLVSQLMTLERQPIDKLNTQVNSYQTKISSFGTLSGLVSGLQTSLQTLTSNFEGYTATSSDATVFSSSATSQAVAGSYALDVANLARAQSLVATQVKPAALRQLATVRQLQSRLILVPLSGVQRIRTVAGSLS